MGRPRKATSDLMNFIADKDEWEWARSDILLGPVRKARAKLESFKRNGAFWTSWTVAQLKLHSKGNRAPGPGAFNLCCPHSGFCFKSRFGFWSPWQVDPGFQTECRKMEAHKLKGHLDEAKAPDGLAALTDELEQQVKILKNMQASRQ